MRTSPFARLFLVALVTIGCGARQQATPPEGVTDQASLQTPTKEILVTVGDLNKPYDILGGVDATLTGQSMYSSMASLDGSASPEAANAAKDLLKKVAYTKYGERVDAIINFKASGSVSGGFWGAFAGTYGANTGVVRAEGIAVAFQRPTPEPAAKPAASPKRRRN